MHRFAWSTRGGDRCRARTAATVATALSLAVALSARPAAAQTQPTPEAAQESRDAEARALFDQGVAALADERYSDALTAFSRSYEIRRVASVALNLGIALRALGRVTEARLRFNEFVEMASPAQHERHDREVATYIQDVSRRIARIHVAAVEPEGARLLIDGRRATLDANDDIATDPGEHTIEGQLQGFTGTPQRVTLEPGGRVEVRVRLAATRPDPRVTVADPNTRPRTPAPPPPITSSPWLWVGIGVGVVAAIAIPTAIVLGNREPVLPGLFCFRTDGSRCATGAM
jgi:hypothetical protein